MREPIEWILATNSGRSQSDFLVVAIPIRPNENIRLFEGPNRPEVLEANQRIPYPKTWSEGDHMTGNERVMQVRQ